MPSTSTFMTAPQYFITSESVTEGHPDKICDQISDAVLDALFAQDPYSRVACDCMVTTGLVLVAGEITTDAYVEIPEIVRKTILEIGYDKAEYGFDGETCGVIVSIKGQSADIALGVDEALESKQGEMACNGDTVEGRQAGLGLSYSAVTGADFSVVGELDRLNSEQEQTLTASLRQPLLAGRGDASAAYEELRSARNAYRAALLSFFVEQEDLIERVISSYLTAIQQQQLVAIRESSVKMAEETVRDARLRLDEGVIAELDLMRAQLRLAGEQRTTVSTSQSLADSIDHLLTLLGLQVGGMPRLVTQVTYEPRDIDLEASVAQALDLRPELRLIGLAIEDREAVLRIARSHRLPSLDLFGEWRRTANGVDDRSWGVGLELSVPIASRSLNEAARQARWDLLVAQQEREDLVQRITAEVRAQVRAA